MRPPRWLSTLASCHNMKPSYVRARCVILGPGRQAVEIKLMLCLCPARAAHYHCPVGKERDSCWPKGLWSYMSGVIDCGEDCGAERIWYSHRHWSLEQEQATVKIKQRTPETTVVFAWPYFREAANHTHATLLSRSSTYCLRNAHVRNYKRLFFFFCVSITSRIPQK